jgi:hypothetical protein
VIIYSGSKPSEFSSKGLSNMCKGSIREDSIVVKSSVSLTPTKKSSSKQSQNQDPNAQNLSDSMMQIEVTPSKQKNLLINLTSNYKAEKKNKSLNDRNPTPLISRVKRNELPYGIQYENSNPFMNNENVMAEEEETFSVDNDL